MNDFYRSIKLKAHLEITLKLKLKKKRVLKHQPIKSGLQIKTFIEATKNGV